MRTCAYPLESYADAAFDGVPLPPQPAPVARLIERVEGRSCQKLWLSRSGTTR
jgi:hypothetical protein